MSVYPISDFADVPNRPGRRARDLVGSFHGFDSVFVTETEMDAASFIPLHTHPVEEAWVVTEGALWVRIGDAEVIVSAGEVARVPPGVPHAVRNDGPDMARAITAAPWARDTFHRDATTFLEGLPPP